jgi:HEPN domain-containing protein
MKRATREWVRKAEADYRLAAKLDRGRERFYDQLCFLCRQAAEKYLKGLLEELSQPIPRVHDCVQLLILLTPHHPGLRGYRRGLAFLTNYAVAARYPGANASKRQAASAMRWATQVRDVCRGLLGLPSPRRRRKFP